MDCIFCRIVAGEATAGILSTTEDGVVIRDVNPQAPVHLLVVSRRHFVDATEASKSDPSIFGRLMSTAVAAATDAGLDRGGYRLVVNTGRDGGQTVPHLHIHVLGGRSMAWPPG